MTELPFATMVRERMRDRGLGLRELCRAAGLDPSFLSKVLAGKRSPPSEEEALRRLAAALGLDATRLIVGAGRIPSGWRRLWSDEELLRSIDRMAMAGAPPAPRPSRAQPASSEPPRERPRSERLERPRSESLGEELL